MSVEAIVVSSFTGIRRPGLTGRVTSRRQLNEPRELVNFHHTREGHLYMPSAAELVWDFSAHGDIRTVTYVENPGGLVVQTTSGRIYHVAIKPPSSTRFPDPMQVTLIATMGAGEEDNPLWVNGIDGATLMGYAPRGSAGPDGDGRTWKLAGTWDAPSVTNISATVGPTASASMLYKGRRFWVKRGRQVYFSELNDFETARPADNTFAIAGDDSGSSYLTNPGYVRGMSAWEDVLVFFLGGSVWTLTGSSPENYSLRQVQTIVGNLAQESLVRIDEGVMSLGGNNLNTRGVYLFTGARSVNLSDNIGDYMGSLGLMWSATFSGGKYIVSTGRDSADGRQFLVYDVDSQEWSVFDGFIRGVVHTQSDHIITAFGGKLYRNSTVMLPRAPGRGAKLRIGFQDDENPSGLVRFLAVKFAGARFGAGAPTVKITASTDKGVVVSESTPIPADVFDNFVVPVNARGAAIELLIEIENTSDSTEVLIENLQVITSRKGEKVSRA